MEEFTSSREHDSGTDIAAFHQHREGDMGTRFQVVLKG